MNDKERHLTVEELARRVGVSTHTVYRWNSRGGGPPYMKLGRHARYRLTDVIAWERSRQQARAS